MSKNLLITLSSDEEGDATPAFEYKSILGSSIVIERRSNKDKSCQPHNKNNLKRGREEADISWITKKKPFKPQISILKKNSRISLTKNAGNLKIPAVRIENMEVAKTINHSNSLRGSTSKKMPSPEIVDLVPDSAQPSYMSPSVILNKPQQSTTMLPQIVNVQSMAKGFNNNFNKTSVNFNHHFNTMRRNNNQSKSSTTLFPMNISKRVGDKLPMPNQKKLREKVVSKPEDGSWQNPFSVKKIQNQEEDEDSVSVINESIQKSTFFSAVNLEKKLLTKRQDSSSTKAATDLNTEKTSNGESNNSEKPTEEKDSKTKGSSSEAKQGKADTKEEVIADDEDLEKKGKHKKKEEDEKNNEVNDLTNENSAEEAEAAEFLEPESSTDEEYDEVYHAYSEFIEMLSSIEKRESDRTKAIEKLNKHYTSADPVYTKSKEFKTLLEKSLESLKANKLLLYFSMKEIIDHLKSRKVIKVNKKRATLREAPPKTETEEADTAEGEELEEKTSNVVLAPKQAKVVKRLVKTLEKVAKKIKKLEEAEVDLDDESDSAYFQMQKYRERFVQLHKKLCEYTDELPDAGRVQSRKIHFSGTKMQKVNRCIEKWLNKTRQFPDFMDIVKLLQDQNSNLGLNLTSEGIRTLAAEVFREIGKLLQRRRMFDLWDSFSSYLEDKNDPATADPNLEQVLQENFEKCRKKEQEIFNFYAEKQQKELLVATEVPEDEADCSPVESGDEDEKEIEAVENSLKEVESDLSDGEEITSGKQDEIERGKPPEKDPEKSPEKTECIENGTANESSTESPKSEVTQKKVKETKNNYKNCKSYKWRREHEGDKGEKANKEDEADKTNKEDKEDIADETDKTKAAEIPESKAPEGPEHQKEEPKLLDSVENDLRSEEKEKTEDVEMEKESECNESDEENKVSDEPCSKPEDSRPLKKVQKQAEEPTETEEKEKISECNGLKEKEKKEEAFPKEGECVIIDEESLEKKKIKHKLLDDKTCPIVLKYENRTPIKRLNSDDCEIIDLDSPDDRKKHKNDENRIFYVNYVHVKQSCNLNEIMNPYCGKKKPGRSTKSKKKLRFFSKNHARPFQDITNIKDLVNRYEESRSFHKSHLVPKKNWERAMDNILFLERTLSGRIPLSHCALKNEEKSASGFNKSNEKGERKESNDHAQDQLNDQKNLLGNGSSGNGEDDKDEENRPHQNGDEDDDKDEEGAEEEERREEVEEESNGSGNEEGKENRTNNNYMERGEENEGPSDAHVEESFCSNSNGEHGDNQMTDEESEKVNNEEFICAKNDENVAENKEVRDEKNEEEYEEHAEENVGEDNEVNMERNDEEIPEGEASEEMNMEECAEKSDEEFVEKECEERSEEDGEEFSEKIEEEHTEEDGEECAEKIEEEHADKSHEEVAESETSDQGKNEEDNLNGEETPENNIENNLEKDDEKVAEENEKNEEFAANEEKLPEEKNEENLDVKCKEVDVKTEVKEEAVPEEEKARKTDEESTDVDENAQTDSEREEDPCQAADVKKEGDSEAETNCETELKPKIKEKEQKVKTEEETEKGEEETENTEEEMEKREEETENAEEETKKREEETDNAEEKTDNAEEETEKMEEETERTEESTEEADVKEEENEETGEEESNIDEGLEDNSEEAHEDEAQQEETQEDEEGEAGASSSRYLRREKVPFEIGPGLSIRKRIKRPGQGSDEIEVIGERKRQRFPFLADNNSNSTSDEERVKRFLQHSPSSISITPPRNSTMVKPPSEAARKALATLRRLKNISTTRVTRRRNEDDVVVLAQTSSQKRPPVNARQNYRGGAQTPNRNTLPVISSVQSMNRLTPKIVTVQGNVPGFSNNTRGYHRRQEPRSSLKISNVRGNLSNTFVRPLLPMGFSNSFRQAMPSPNPGNKAKNNKKVEYVELD